MFILISVFVFYGGSCGILVFVLVCLFVGVLFVLKERENIKLGGEDLGGVRGKGKLHQNIFHEKKFLIKRKIKTSAS